MKYSGTFRKRASLNEIFHDVVASCFLVMMTGTFERALLFQLHQPKPGGWASPVLSALVIILWSSALEEGIHLSCHVQLLPDISAPRTRRCKKKDSAHHCRFLVWVGRVRNLAALQMGRWVVQQSFLAMVEVLKHGRNIPFLAGTTLMNPWVCCNGLLYHWTICVAEDGSHEIIIALVGYKMVLRSQVGLKLALLIRIHGDSYSEMGQQTPNKHNYKTSSPIHASQCQASLWRGLAAKLAPAVAEWMLPKGHHILGYT